MLSDLAAFNTAIVIAAMRYANSLLIQSAHNNLPHESVYACAEYTNPIMV